MMPIRTCKICGSPMETKSFMSTAADTLFTRYTCTGCKREETELSIVAMEKDNKTILQKIHEYYETGELPWPDP